jgi:hypothetical protein
MNLNISELSEKFEEVLNDTIKGLASESHYNFDAKFALSSVKLSNNIIRVDNFIIKLKKENLYGTEKIFYDIYDERENKLVASKLSLFITVLYIIKNYRKNTYCSEYQSVINLDNNYQIKFCDIAFQKKMIKETSNKEKREIYNAKYHGNIDALNRIKSQIMKIT